MSDYFNTTFSRDTLNTIFPKNRADHFFDAMYGDASDGAYDITLEFRKGNEKQLQFEFRLTQRPGKCLVCNLTYGLPQVFMRHPVININTIISDIGGLISKTFRIKSWELGTTLEHSRELHIIPLIVELEN